MSKLSERPGQLDRHQFGVNLPIDSAPAERFEISVRDAFAAGRGEDVLNRIWLKSDIKKEWLPDLIVINKPSAPIDTEDPEVKNRYERYIVPIVNRLEMLFDSNVEPDLSIHVINNEQITEELIPAFCFNGVSFQDSTRLFLNTAHGSTPDTSGYYYKSSDGSSSLLLIIAKINNELRFKYSEYRVPKYISFMPQGPDDLFGEPVIGNMNFLANSSPDKLEWLLQGIDYMLNPPEPDDDEEDEAEIDVEEIDFDLLTTDKIYNLGIEVENPSKIYNNHKTISDTRKRGMTYPAKIEAKQEVTYPKKPFSRLLSLILGTTDGSIK